MLNTSHATLRYYKGIIRDLDAKLKNALVRISKLEQQIRKMRQVSPREPNNVETLGHQSYPLLETTATGGVGGLSREAIIAIVNDAIENALLTVPVHDHTANDKGGDCYAGLGAKLI